jgi:hypothetical protein
MIRNVIVVDILLFQRRTLEEVAAALAEREGGITHDET